MIGTIQHLLNSGDAFLTGTSFLVLLYLIVMIIIYGKMSKNEKHKKIWNILCVIPLTFSVIHPILFVCGDAFKYIISNYLNIYITSVLIALLPLLAKKNPLRIIGNILGIMVCLVFSVLSLENGKFADYTDKSMSDAYISLCGFLEENYVLSEWKKVDYEKLKADGLALIEEAEKTGDTDKYYDALYMLVDSFHDGHAGVIIDDAQSSYAMDKITSFGDYGLSLITLDNGDTIAVNAEEGLAIKDGDVITKWNGVPVDEAIDNVSLPITAGTLENERVQKTFYLAGVGGDTVNVTYINSEGTEAVATLNRIEGNMPRAASDFGILTSSKNEEYDYRMLSDNIGYLRVVEESTDNLSDMIGYITGNHTTAREMYREDLRELRTQGMKKLVIDIRNNAGGFDEVATALTSLFTKEQMYAFSLGVKNDKEMKSVTDRYVKGDGEFSDLEILVLTGMRCGSAGDGLTLYLSRLPNVTVAGLTDPEGINQETGGIVYMPEKAIVFFPTGLVLDENGNPNIDIDHTRKSRNPVDIKISLDKESALKIFSGEDYELEWAMEYLNKME